MNRKFLLGMFGMVLLIMGKNLEPKIGSFYLIFIFLGGALNGYALAME